MRVERRDAEVALAGGSEARTRGADDVGLREQITAMGGEIRFEQRVTDLLIEGSEGNRKVRGLMVLDNRQVAMAAPVRYLSYGIDTVLLAAALLPVIGFHHLFAGTVVGFLASAALVVFVVLPTSPATQRRGIYDRTTRGLRIYLATPRLRNLRGLHTGDIRPSVVLDKAPSGIPSCTTGPAQ